MCRSLVFTRAPLAAQSPGATGEYDSCGSSPRILLTTASLDSSVTSIGSGATAIGSPGSTRTAKVPSVTSSLQSLPR